MAAVKLSGRDRELLEQAARHSTDARETRRALALLDLADGQKPGQVAVKMPKNWLITCDPQVHGVVVFVLEHQTDTEAGYAFPPDAAKKIAAGLIKNADLVIAGKPVKNPPAVGG